MTDLSLINIGAAANDGTGDTARDAFSKTNAAIAGVNRFNNTKRRAIATSKLVHPWFGQSKTLNTNLNPVTPTTGTLDDTNPAYYYGSRGRTWAGITQATYRHLRILNAPVSLDCALGYKEITFEYANFNTTAVAPVNEYSPGPITLKPRMFYNTTTSLTSWDPSHIGDTPIDYYATSSGAWPLVLQPGEKGWVKFRVWNKSGIVSFYEGINVSGANGWPVGNTASTYYAMGEDLTDKPAGIPWLYGSIADYCAYNITVETVEYIPGLLAIGHSQVCGTGNNQGDLSFIDYACGFSSARTATVRNTVPMRKLGCPGDRIVDLLANGHNRFQCIGDEPDFSRIFVMLGSNDFAAGLGLNAVKASFIKLLLRLQGYGKPITVSTITIRTDSSNTPLTTATGSAATGDAMTFEQARNAFNAWLPSLVGLYGVDRVYDPNLFLESATVPGTWADLKLTTDYVHLSGGALGTGTSGTLGSGSAGGGQEGLGAHFRAFLDTLPM